MSETCPDGPGSRWLPDDVGIVHGGQVGGDDQAGESFSVRFRRADRPGAMITRTAYPVNSGGGCREQFLVRVETEWLVCSDSADPGGTELWSNRVSDDEAVAYETAAEAEHAAWNVASELLRDVGSYSWDGFPRWEPGDP